jgi:hypothetical protein
MLHREVAPSNISLKTPRCTTDPGGLYHIYNLASSLKPRSYVPDSDFWKLVPAKLGQIMRREAVQVRLYWRMIEVSTEGKLKALATAEASKRE